MLVVVVGVFPYPLVRPGIHVHAGFVAVGLKARTDFSRDGTRDTLDGKACRRHGFRKRPLRVHAPYPVCQRLHVAQGRSPAFRQVQHLLPVQAETLAHPQPVLRVRLLDADVLDQEGAGEVVFHLDQGFRQELREIVDERVDLQDPALHLLDTEARRGYRFRPWTVDQGVPMGSHEFVHRSDPPRVRGYLVYRTGIHGLLSQVVELRIVAGTAQFVWEPRVESVPVRGIPPDACSRNEPGGESQWPCAKSTPISRSAARPISPSTASPIVFLPITCPTSLMARTIARSTLSCATSFTKLPSILRKSTGRCLRYPKEDIPAPKSSSENRQPSDFSSPKNRAALSKLAIAAVSVSSKQIVPGRMT